VEEPPTVAVGRVERGLAPRSTTTATRRDKSFDRGGRACGYGSARELAWWDGWELVVCRGGAGRHSYGVVVAREVATTTTAKVTEGNRRRVRNMGTGRRRTIHYPQSEAAVLYLVLLPRQHRL